MGNWPIAQEYEDDNVFTSGEAYALSWEAIANDAPMLEMYITQICLGLQQLQQTPHSHQQLTLNSPGTDLWSFETNRSHL